MKYGRLLRTFDFWVSRPAVARDVFVDSSYFELRRGLIGISYANQSFIAKYAAQLKAEPYVAGILKLLREAHV